MLWLVCTDDDDYADVVKGLHLCLILYLQPYLLYEIGEGTGADSPEPSLLV